MSSAPDFVWLFLKLSGRVGQAAYVLASLLILVIQALLLYLFTLQPEGSAASEMLALAFVAGVLIGTWANIALAVKRLHDFGRPGAVSVAFLVGGYVLVIILALFRSDPGPNRYGNAPNEPA
ncbi:MAG: DUF805 domain-containing protein [Rhizobiaceae bacterium]